MLTSVTWTTNCLKRQYLYVHLMVHPVQTRMPVHLKIWGFKVQWMLNYQHHPFQVRSPMKSIYIEITFTQDDVAVRNNSTLPCLHTPSNHALDSDVTSDSSSEGNNLESNATSVDRHPRING